MSIEQSIIQNKLDVASQIKELKNPFIPWSDRHFKMAKKAGVLFENSIDNSFNKLEKDRAYFLSQINGYIEWFSKNPKTIRLVKRGGKQDLKYEYIREAKGELKQNEIFVREYSQMFTVTGRTSFNYMPVEGKDYLQVESTKPIIVPFGIFQVLSKIKHPVSEDEFIVKLEQPFSHENWIP